MRWFSLSPKGRGNTASLLILQKALKISAGWPSPMKTLPSCLSIFLNTLNLLQWLLGNKGTKFDESVAPSNTTPCKPVYDHSHYHYLSWGGEKPCVWIECSWEDISFRIEPLNILTNMRKKLVSEHTPIDFALTYHGWQRRKFIDHWPLARLKVVNIGNKYNGPVIHQYN